jgi:hypothetical protein
MKYFVEVKEVHNSICDVEGPAGLSREKLIDAAKRQIESGECDVLEYSHTLDPDVWVVRTDKGDFVE